jgi:hypothetical protein
MADTINSKIDNRIIDNRINDKIINYFIDNQIILNEDDDNYTKIKKYLLKYKRIIALVLLIILLVIGYYCNPYSDDNYLNIDSSINNSKNSKNIQNGGAALIAKVGSSVGSSVAKNAASGAIKDAAKDAVKDAAGDAKKSFGDKIKDKIKEKGDKSQAKLELKGEKAMEKLKAGKDSAIQGIKNSPTAMYDAGAAVAHKFKDNAGVIYQVLYSIAIFIVICIVLLPSLAFIVIGIICYFLLRGKMKVIKGL